MQENVSQDLLFYLKSIDRKFTAILVICFIVFLLVIASALFYRANAVGFSSSIIQDEIQSSWVARTISDEAEMRLINTKCVVNENKSSLICKFIPTGDYLLALNTPIKDRETATASALLSVGVISDAVDMSTIPITIIKGNLIPTTETFSAEDLADGSETIEISYTELRDGDSFKIGFNSEIIKIEATGISGDYSPQRKIVRSPDGTKIYVTYNANNSIFFTQSINSGSTWSEPTVISYKSDYLSAQNPAIAISSNGEVGVVFSMDNSFTDEGIYYTHCASNCDDNTSWNEPTEIITPMDYTNPSIIYGTDNVIRVGYLNIMDSSINYQTCQDNASAEWCDTDANWVGGTINDSGSGNVGGLDFAISDKNVMVAYNGTNGVMFSYCAGETEDCSDVDNWEDALGGEEAQIGSVGSTSPSIVVSDTNAHVVFIDENFHLKYMTCDYKDVYTIPATYKGCKIPQVYMSDEILISGTNTVARPTLSISADKNLFALYKNVLTSELWYASCSVLNKDCTKTSNWTNTEITGITLPVGYPSVRATTVTGSYFPRLDYIWLQDQNILFYDYLDFAEKSAMFSDLNVFRWNDFSQNADLNFFSDVNIVFDFNIHLEDFNVQATKLYYTHNTGVTNDTNCYLKVKGVNYCGWNQYSFLEWSNVESDNNTFHVQSSTAPDYIYKKSIFNQNPERYRAEYIDTNILLQRTLGVIKGDAVFTIFKENDDYYDANKIFKVGFSAGFSGDNSYLLVKDCTDISISAGGFGDPFPSNCTEHIVTRDSPKENGLYVIYLPVSDDNKILGKTLNADKNILIDFSCKYFNEDMNTTTNAPLDVNEYCYLNVIDTNQDNRIGGDMTHFTPNGYLGSQPIYTYGAGIHFYYEPFVSMAVIDKTKTNTFQWKIQASSPLSEIDFNSDVYSEQIDNVNYAPQIIGFGIQNADYYLGVKGSVFKPSLTVYDPNSDNIVCDFYLQDANREKSYLIQEGATVTDMVCSTDYNYPDHAPDGNYYFNANVRETGTTELLRTDFNSAGFFSLDSNPPTTINDYNGYCSETDINIILTCSDSFSSCWRTYYKKGDGNITHYTMPITITQADGNVMITYYSYDYFTDSPALQQTNRESDNNVWVMIQSTGSCSPAPIIATISSERYLNKINIIIIIIVFSLLIQLLSYFMLDAKEMIIYCFMILTVALITVVVAVL